MSLLLQEVASIRKWKNVGVIPNSVEVRHFTNLVMSSTNICPPMCTATFWCKALVPLNGTLPANLVRWKQSKKFFFTSFLNRDEACKVMVKQQQVPFPNMPCCCWQPEYENVPYNLQPCWLCRDKAACHRALVEGQPSKPESSKACMSEPPGKHRLLVIPLPRDTFCSAFIPWFWGTLA